MEPQLPTPVRGPEGGQTSSPQGAEQFRVQPAQEIIAPPEQQGGETREVVQDGPKGDPTAAQPTFTPPPMPVITPAKTDANATTKTADDDMPTDAADADLIEEEWVKKAKKVIAETKDDPHAQEHAVSRVRAEYIQKRYGRTITPNSGD